MSGTVPTVTLYDDDIFDLDGSKVYHVSWESLLRMLPDAWIADGIGSPQVPVPASEDRASGCSSKRKGSLPQRYIKDHFKRPKYWVDVRVSCSVL
jgi:hypothetical protein